MNLKRPLIILSTAASIYSASACAHYFQPSYLYYEKNAYFVSLNRDAAFKHFVKMHQDLLREPFEFKEGTSTLKAERLDIAAAVTTRLSHWPVDRQNELIEKCYNYVFNWRNSSQCDVNDFTDLPEELDEFKLYLAGYGELLKDPDLAQCPKAWEKLLKLPPERRTYRTAWVHFMLGNHFKADCHTHYENCRQAVREGFVDTPGLALRSYTLEIRYGKNPALVIRRAAEAEQSGSSLKFLESINRFWLEKRSDAEYLSMLEDPLAREFLAIVDLSPRFERMIKGYKLRSADIRACHAYRKGDITLARQYISQLEKPTLLSLYIEAKLARHTGNIFLATKKLQQWLKMAENASPVEKTSLVNVKDYWGDYHTNVEKDVYGLLGSALVMRHDFQEAAEFLYRANSTTDVTKILEHYFTLSEAAEFVAKLGDSATDQELKYLVSRRAFRENNFELAQKYMPENEHQHLKDYVAFMEQGNNKKLDPDSRAIAFYNAAKILRYHGMELAGTQDAPDYFPGGSGTGLPYDNCAVSKKEDKCHFNPITGTWDKICDKHWPLHQSDSIFSFPGFNAPRNYSTVHPAQRFHYRHRAALLAMKAGKIAADDDLRAIIYIFGGNCMRKTSLPEADIFYKMLVNECKKSLLSKLADRQRWFPTSCVRMNKEVNHATPLKDMAAVKNLISEIFQGQSNSIPE